MNYYGISGCGFLLFVCVFILWASEREEQIMLWLTEREARLKRIVFDVKTCLRCINNGEDL